MASCVRNHRVVDGEVKARAQASWFTNLNHDKRHEELMLYKRHTPEEYPYYDNERCDRSRKVAKIL
ncbi:adenine-specific methyltransferase EcoRI family protein [Neisseria canis]